MGRHTFTLFMDNKNEKFTSNKGNIKIAYPVAYCKIKLCFLDYSVYVPYDKIEEEIDKKHFDSNHTYNSWKNSLNIYEVQSEDETDFQKPVENLE